MKWKPMKEMSINEVESLLINLFGIKKVESVLPSNEKNMLTVVIVTEEKENENGELTDLKETVQLTPDTILNFNFSKDVLCYHDYKEYMLNNGYSEYWRDNPFI